MPSGNTTTTGENTAGPLTGAEWIRGVQSGGNVKMLTSAIAALYSPTSVIGDMIVRGSSGDGRLSVGPNGYVLFADSTQTLGVKWDGPVVKSADLANAANGFGVDKVGGASRVVSSIAALRALLKTGIGQARVTGYYAAGDGGGGQYFYDSTDTTSADNGGTIIVASDGGRWKMAPYAMYSPRQFGAKTDGTDASAAIQATMVWATSVGAAVAFVDGGTYTCTPAIPQTGAANYNTAMQMLSGLQCIGAFGTTIKVSDNYSTDANPKELALFSTSTNLHGVTFSGITFDLNGANNKMSPSRPTTYNQFNHAAILVNGPNGWMDDVRIENCVFKNTAGVCYVVGALVAVGTTPNLGKTWKITNNYFINGGLDTNDHTSVYGWYEDAIVSGNTFWEDLPPHSVGKTGGATGYEIHGSNQRVTGNYFYNYTLGLYIAPNFTNTTLNTIVQGNHFYCSDAGIELWRGVAIGYLEIAGVLIQDNTFYFDSYTYTGQPLFKAAIRYTGQISTVQGSINNVKIDGNTATSVSTTLQAQLLHFDSSTTAGNVCSNWSVTNNQTVGMTDSVSIITNSASGMGLLEISRNQFISGNSDALSNPPHGIYINANGSGISTLVIDQNQFVDERGSPHMQVGIYLAAGGVIHDLALGPQTFKGMTAANFQNAGATITNQIGSAATEGANVVADGGTITFNADYVGLTPKAILCTGSVAGEIVSVTTFGANTFTVAIKKWTGGTLTAGTSQTVYWRVRF